MSASLLPLPTTRNVVRVAADGASLTGELTIPLDAHAIIVFARTNSGGLRSMEDLRMADALHASGFATLYFDLLTPDEELVDGPTRRLHDDLALLSRRLIDTVDWCGQQPSTMDLPIALFGEGPSGSAALVAACVRPRQIAAVVTLSRAPDQAAPVLARVQAPTLFIAAGDEASMRANDAAFYRLRGEKELVRLGGSDGRTVDVDEVARLAIGWFERHLSNAWAPRATGANL